MYIASLLKRIWHSLPWRRTHVRTPTALTVDWRVPGSRTHRVSPISDVSPGGAFLFTDEPKSVDTPLVLEVATPTGWVQMHARVAWASAHGMGVRFCEPKAT